MQATATSIPQCPAPQTAHMITILECTTTSKIDFALATHRQYILPVDTRQEAKRFSAHEKDIWHRHVTVPGHTHTQNQYSSSLPSAVCMNVAHVW